MDMSKLPRMSQTPPPPPPELQDPDPRVPATAYAYDPPATGTAAEAWISIAIGAILLLMSPRLFQYLLSPSSFSQRWTFSAPDGSPLTYPQTVFFWGDLALVSFALVLILDGIVMAFVRRSAVLMATFAFTILAVVMNLIYLIAMLWGGYGLQIISALAVAFGVYIAIHQWRHISLIAAFRRTPGG